MMKVANQYNTRRRKALAFGSIAGSISALGRPVAAAPATAQNRDAELLILCAEFHRTQADLDHWCATGPELEPSPSDEEAYRLWGAENDRIYSANHDIYTEIIDMPAKTLAGIVAKSKVLAVHMERVVMGNSGIGDHEMFAYKLAQEAAQVAGGAG